MRPHPRLGCPWSPNQLMRVRGISTHQNTCLCKLVRMHVLLDKTAHSGLPLCMSCVIHMCAGICVCRQCQPGVEPFTILTHFAGYLATMSQPEHVEGGRDNAALVNGGFVPKIKPFGEVSASFRLEWTPLSWPSYAFAKGSISTMYRQIFWGLGVCPTSAVP